MFDNKVFAIHRLRVNIKSLAAESKIIRDECKRCGAAYFNQLVEHRRGKLRYESRLAQLALTYLRGRPYRMIEKEGSKIINSRHLYDKINRFIKVDLDEIKKWLN